MNLFRSTMQSVTIKITEIAKQFVRLIFSGILLPSRYFSLKPPINYIKNSSLNQ